MCGRLRSSRTRTLSSISQVAKARHLGSTRSSNVARPTEQLAGAIDFGRPHDDHGDAERSLSLRRRAVVQHRVWARRHHHGAADALDEPATSPRACCAFSRRHRPTGRVPERDAEPGKILHEMRGGEMAVLGEVPFGRYYGSVDSTPLFVLLAGAYYERTGDRALIDSIWPQHRERPALDRSTTATSTATASSNTPGGRRRAWSSRVGRIRRTRCSTTTASSRKAPIALVRSAGATSTPRDRRRPRLARARATSRAADALATSGELRCARGSRTRSGRGPRTYALALDGEKRPARPHVERRPVPVHRHRAAGSRAEVAESLLDRACSPAGASGRSTPAKRATTRCPTTTARSGRTTTR